MKPKCEPTPEPSSNYNLWPRGSAAPDKSVDLHVSDEDSDVPPVDPPVDLVKKKPGCQTLNSLKAGLLDPQDIGKATAKFNEDNSLT